MTAALKDALAKVEAAHAAAKAEAGPAEHSAEWWDRWRDIMHRLEDQLRADLGARISDPIAGARVSIAGVSATCTAGVSGALHNWCAAARRKLEAGQ